MIPFFRKIRKKLAVDNQFLKYSRYAIGEIVLVMLGILLALQVNNWNEYKKDRILEKKVLENFVENLENKQRKLKRGIKSIERYRKSGRIVLKVLADSKSYPDSINLYMHRATMQTGQITLSNIGYYFFKDAGFGIIQNEELAKKITIFFEEDVTGFHKNLSWEKRGQIDYERFIDEHFWIAPSQSSTGPIHTPYNKNELLKNNYFRSLISKIDVQRNFFKNVMSSHLVESEALLLSIKNKLKTFK